MFNLEGLKCLIWKIVIFEDGDILLIPVIWCNIHIYKFLSVGNISFFYFTPTSPVWQWSPPGSTRWRSGGAVHSRGSGLQRVRLVTLMVGYAIGYRNDIEMMDIVGATCLMHLKSSSLIWNQACSCCYDLDKFIQAGSDGSCFAMGVVFFLRLPYMTRGHTYMFHHVPLFSENCPWQFSSNGVFGTVWGGWNQFPF